MPKYEAGDINEQAWEQFIVSHPEANFLHSWQWGEFHTKLGKTVVRRGLYRSGELVGVVVGVVEPARRGRHLSIAGGPIIDWRDIELVATVVDELRRLATENNCVFVRVRPQLEKTPESLSLFKQVGFKPAPMYLSAEHVGIIDLTQSDEAIMSGLSSSLRRKIRQAEKAGVKVEVTKDKGRLREFYDIQLETAKRQQFVPFSFDFLEKQFEAFAERDQVLLYTASHEEEVLAQNFIIFYGQEADYHYGVSTEAGTRLSAAPLLHLEAIREARRRGCSRYNFWGIVDLDDTKHRFYGVSQFKRSFGVKDLKYVPAHDLVIKPAAYLKNWVVETLRRKSRHV